MQLKLPYVEVENACKSAMAAFGDGNLVQHMTNDEPFLNFALDALLSSLIGTVARDFQLNLTDDTPASYDVELAVRAV